MDKPKQSCDILIRGTAYLDEDWNLKTGDIAIADGKILSLEAGSGWESKEMLRGEGLVWMPGMVDGHTHTSQQLLRGRLLDEKPVIWKRINVPFESTLTEEDSTLSAELAALEMIHSGTTAFADAGGKYVEAFARVYQKSGLRGLLSYMTNDNPSMPDSLRVSPQESLRRLSDLNRDLKGGLLRGIYSVTALSAVSREMLELIFGQAKEKGIILETHMNEYPSEIFEFIERYGVRPFEFLEREGLISGQMMAAHCIFLSEGEIEVMAAHKVRVSHCPFSNCGKGIPPTPQLLARGIPVGFGSDGSAHGGLDLFKELRLFRGLMNAHFGQTCADPSIMPAKRLLGMATGGGAAGLIEEGLGRLSPGGAADLIAIDWNAAHLFPTNSITNTLVESASGADVVHMLVDGKLVMKDRVVLTLDEEEIMARARAYAARSPHMGTSCGR